MQTILATDLKYKTHGSPLLNTKNKNKTQKTAAPSDSDDSGEGDAHTDDGDTDGPDDSSHCPSSSEEEEDDGSDDNSKRRVRHRKQQPALRVLNALRSPHGMPPPAKQRGSSVRCVYIVACLRL